MAQQTQIPSSPTADEASNRFQRWVMETVKSLWSYIVVPVYTSAKRPVASEQWAGRFIRVRDSSQPEQLQFCLRNANGAWSWAVVSISPQ